MTQSKESGKRIHTFTISQWKALIFSVYHSTFWFAISFQPPSWQGSNFTYNLTPCNRQTTKSLDTKWKNTNTINIDACTRWPGFTRKQLNMHTVLINNWHYDKHWSFCKKSWKGHFNVVKGRDVQCMLNACLVVSIVLEAE